MILGTQLTRTKTGSRGVSMEWRRDRDMDIDSLARNWWALALRGVAAMIFGVLAFVLPGVTLAVLILLFGGYALVEGILNVIAAVRGRGDDQPWWALLLEGLVSIAAGIVAFVVPGVTGLALLYIIAAWAIVTGPLEIVAAIRLRRWITGEARLVLNGVLSIAFGVLTMLMPGAGALSLAWLIGAYAIVFGALLLGVSFRLRGSRPQQTRPVARGAGLARTERDRLGVPASRAG